MNTDREPPAGETAATILRIALTGALATLDEHGSPYASHVSVATTPAGEPILLLSGLALHTGNIARDRRASLLVVDDRVISGDPVATARLSVSGVMDAPSDDPHLKRRFLARHPEATGYAEFADFAFYRLTIERAHLVAGFGRIVDLAPSELLVETSASSDLAAAEPALLDWLNDGDPGRLIDTAPGAGAATGWRATGIDAHGVDLLRGVERERIVFDESLATGEAARAALTQRLAHSGTG